MSSLAAFLALVMASPLAAWDDDDKERAPRKTRAGQSALSASALSRGPAVQAAGRALSEGLAYLGRRQKETVNGSLPVDDAATGSRAPVGITALGALAFMAGGNSPGRGPHGHHLEQAIDYLLEHTNLAPESTTYGYISSSVDQWSRTHGHGYATLALAQAYGMSGRPERIGRALRAAVALIESSQGSEGGWEYEPRPQAAHEGSVTICLVQALRAARNVGIAVDGKVIVRADDYVKRLQKPDGTFRYTLGDERSSLALTAAAVSTLNMTGSYDTAIIRDAVDAIWSGLGLREVDGGRRTRPHPYYERLYMAQALWQLSDTSHFERWFLEEREVVLGQQRADGSWRDRQWGDCYATAVNCLVLALPDGVLPIFQR